MLSRDARKLHGHGFENFVLLPCANAQRGNEQRRRCVCSAYVIHPAGDYDIFFSEGAHFRARIGASDDHLDAWGVHMGKYIVDQLFRRVHVGWVAHVTREQQYVLFLRIISKVNSAEKFGIDAVGYDFDVVILCVLNKLSIGTADDGFAIEVVEYGRFKALETAVFNPVQPPQRQWSESRLTCDSSTQRIHVVDDLRNVVHVLYVGRHADQLAIDYVGLNVRDVLIQLAFRRTLVKPVHLERSRTEWSQCKPKNRFAALMRCTKRPFVMLPSGVLSALTKVSLPEVRQNKYTSWVLANSRIWW